MAYNAIIFKNPHTGVTREAPVGFCWPIFFLIFLPPFFLSFMPPLFRKDWKWFLIMFIIGIMTIGFSGFVFMFIYNKCYIKDLINDGFKAVAVKKHNLDYIARKMKLDIPAAEPSEL